METDEYGVDPHESERNELREELYDEHDQWVEKERKVMSFERKFDAAWTQHEYRLKIKDLEKELTRKDSQILRLGNLYRAEQGVCLKACEKIEDLHEENKELSAENIRLYRQLEDIINKKVKLEAESKKLFDQLSKVIGEKMDSI